MFGRVGRAHADVLANNIDAVKGKVKIFAVVPKAVVKICKISCIIRNLLGSIEAARLNMFRFAKLLTFFYNRSHKFISIRRKLRCKRPKGPL